MAKVQVQEVDFKALAEKLARECEGLLREAGQHIGRRNVKKHYHFMVQEEACRSALREYHAAVLPPDSHPGWDRLAKAVTPTP